APRSQILRWQLCACARLTRRPVAKGLFITEEMFREAVELSIEKKKNIEHTRLRFESYEEGLCVQAFHLGDYKKMNDTLNNMISFAEEKQLNYERDTHDIYLNDSRKTKTENLKTIMRVKVCEKE
ncbi:MAG: GyrI-like domain-containing protein, partial [Bacteroidales bacterium]